MVKSGVEEREKFMWKALKIIIIRERFQRGNVLYGKRKKYQDQLGENKELSY